MTYRIFAGAAALAVALGSAPAMADDPNDALLSRSAAARARDKAIIQQLNRNELKRDQARDAEYAKGWAAWRAYPQLQAEYDRAMERHRAERADYDRRMADWREAVRRCKAGEYRYCDG